MHKVSHRITVFFSIVSFFWGGQVILDAFSGDGELSYTIAGFIVIALMLFFLYIDDLYLRELE